MPDREGLIQRLTEESEEFRRLREDHQGYERELADLQSHPYLTAEQQWRVSELKKLKLVTKDHMESVILRSQRAAQTPA